MLGTSELFILIRNRRARTEDLVEVVIKMAKVGRIASSRFLRGQLFN